MKKLLFYPILILGLLLSSCYKDDIADLKHRLEAMEGTQIASVKEQVNSIKNSLPQLEKTDKDLGEYIKSLQGIAADLQKSIDSTDTKLVDELALINSTISRLRLTDDELDEKISILYLYVDRQVAGSKDWANATFATLEQYSSMSKEIATVKASIEALNNGIGSSDALKKEITAAYTAYVACSISDVENSMKLWVSDQLKGYYTIAETEGKLAALQSIITANDKVLHAEIDALIASLDAAKMETEEGYMKAIEDAIKENNGVVDSKIAIAIAEVNVRIENEIESINRNIDAIETRLDKVEDDIATIGEQIKNINNTIISLENANVELDGYIETLQNTAVNFENSIASINDKIAELEASLKEGSSGDNAEVLGQLEKLKSDMEDELSVINATVSALQLKDEELDGKIEDLKDFIESELSVSTDWANATFATLELFASLSEEVAAVKAHMNSISQNIAAFEERINGKIENDIAAAVYSAVAAAKDEITAAYTSAIQSSISSLESSMKSWVNSELQDYCTIYEVNGMLQALRNSITSGDDDLRDEIEALEQDVAASKQELMGVYSEVVKDAITENNGLIDQKIEDALAQAVSRIDGQMQGIIADITAIQSRLSKVEGDIADIKSQIANINSTILELQNAQDELDSYIGSLESAASGLEESLDAINDKIDGIESALQGEVSEVKAEISAQLLALKSDVEGELAQINETVSVLKSKDAELEDKIEYLQSFVESELDGNKSWANATFATLEQQSALANEVATVKAQIVAINQSVSDMEARINSKISKDITDAVAALDSSIQEKVSEVTSAYTSAISKAKDDITAAYTTEIQSAISSLETSLKSWISTQLAGYYTIAEVDAKLSAMTTEFNSLLASQKAYLEALISSGSDEDDNEEMYQEISTAISNNEKAIANNAADILELQQNLSGTKDEITEAYKSLISTSIVTLEGALTGEIALQVSTINTRINNEVASINSAIDALTARVTALENEVDEIQQQISDILAELANLKQNISNIFKHIQSVTYLIKYADGKAVIKDGAVELDFQISPKEVVKDIADNWQSVLSVKAIYTITRAVSFIDLPIISCEADLANGVITVTASSENLSEEIFAGIQNANLALYISDGNNSISSNYVPVTAYHPYNEIWYTSTNMQIVTPNATGVFGANIISNTIENGRGVIRFDGPVTSIGDNAFKNNTTLTSVIVPERVESIGAYAFCKCTSLTDINFPESVKMIGNQAFEGCIGLTEIDFGMGVETLGDKVFYNCTGLQKVIVNTGITAGSDCFYKCDKLTGIHTNNLSAYCRCSLKYKAETVYVNDVPLTEFVIPSDVTDILNSAFEDCKSITKVVVHKDVKTIGKSAFNGCSNMTELTICGPVAIDQYAFDDYLENVYITSLVPPSLYYYFGAYSDVAGGYYYYSIPINEGICFYVPSEAFNTYLSYTKTYNSQIVQDNWYGYRNYIVPYDFDTGTIVRLNNQIWYTSSDGKTVSPYSSSVFGSSLLANSYINGVGRITFKDDVNTIGEKAFYTRSKLTSVFLPETVTEIGKSAFQSCSNLLSVYCNPTTPPAIYYQSGSSTSSFPSNAGMKIYVPASAFDSYTQYSTSSYEDKVVSPLNWSQYQSYIQEIH